MKTILAVLIGLLLAAGVVFGTALILFNRYNKAGEAIEDSTSRFVVEKGETLGEVAYNLKKEDIIRSSKLMRLAAKVKKNEQDIKSGTYDIPQGSTILEILEMLTLGQQQLVRVTIPEGMTLRKTALILEEKNILQAEAFIEAAASSDFMKELQIPGNTAEGFLYPDTYFFPENYDANKVITTMTENFFSKLTEIMPAWKEMKSEEIYKKMIFASIIEREYRVPMEAPKIASVFYNRYDKGIGLESCATIEYIITEEQNREHPGYITLNDLKIDSLYNTYKWAALPPTPICNPGAIALNAAFHPENTEYYYFVLKDEDTGEHHFSESLDEHAKAKRYYLKSFN